MPVRRSLAALICALSLAPSVARADVPDSDKATARQLTVDGFDALAKKDYAAAAGLFQRADALYHAPMITLGYARAQVGLGKLVSAQELYNKLVHETLPAGASATVVKAVQDGRAELRALEPRVPSVVIVVKGSDAATVTLDGAAVPPAALGVKRPVDPGKHVIAASATGFAAAETTVTIAEGKSETVTLQLEPLPPGATPPVPTTAPTATPGPTATTGPAATSSPAATSLPWPSASATLSDPGRTQRFAGFVLGGAGVASLLVSGITGGLALAGEAGDSQCTSAGGKLFCDDAGFEKQSQARTLAWASTVTMIAGGALAGAGLVVVLLAPKAPAPATGLASSSVRLTAAGMAWEGSF